MEIIKLHDKEFKAYLPHEEIQKIVKRVAEQINKDLAGKDVIFLAILNGSFMFAADLFKEINLNCQITFLKLASYAGESSTGTVRKLIGFNEDITNKTVVIIEDIVDTGTTLVRIYQQLLYMRPSEIKIATFLHKPEAYKQEYPLDYVGMDIPNLFVVGYGLDYDGLGRNLKDIYTVI